VSANMTERFAVALGGLVRGRLHLSLIEVLCHVGERISAHQVHDERPE